jgi:molecular chaperone HscC
MPSAAPAILALDVGVGTIRAATLAADGQATILANRDGDLATPALFYLESAGRLLGGRAALNATRADPQHSIQFSLANKAPVQVGATNLTQAEALALLLRRVVRDSGNTQHTPDVVLTWSATGHSAWQTLVLEAAALARLRVRLVVPSVIAAATWLWLNHEPRGYNLLAYDLGAETCHIALVGIYAQHVESLVASESTALGGRVLDEALATLLTNEFAAAHPTTPHPLSDPLTKYELTRAAEALRHQLGSLQTVHYNVQHHGRQQRVQLPRQRVAGNFESQIERSISLLRQVLNEAQQLRYAAPTQLLLLGGASRTAVVKRRVSEALNLPMLAHDPEQIAARGAAVIAGLVQARDALRSDLAARGERLDLASDHLLAEASQAVASLTHLPPQLIKAAFTLRFDTLPVALIDPDQRAHQARILDRYEVL